MHDMELRHHPLMSYRGVPTWPPVWVWTGGGERVERRITGEIGTLLEVVLPDIEPRCRCQLTIQHDAARYLGVLLFDEPFFCRQVYGFLQGCCGRLIRDIGSMDISSLA
jgi:hypothetical protein